MGVNDIGHEMAHITSQVKDTWLYVCMSMVVIYRTTQDILLPKMST